jgi:4-methyl-5(b-hydroxyethyl)-thiazole monophosphate biosynthesis
MPRVLVPLAEGFEELEAITITDLLTRAKIDVITAGLKPGPVTASRGTRVIPVTDLDEALHQSYDMIALPGGLPGADHLRDDPRIIALVKKMSEEGKFVAAICAAPKALAAAGLLDEKHATGFPGSIDAARFPAIKIENSPVVRDGNIITSRGPGTAMDFALDLIALLVGKDIRDQVENGLQRPTAHRAAK